MPGSIDTKQTIGEYPISQILGRGGFGEVYLGHHPVLDIPVAIKVMHSSKANKEYESRFEQEAKTAAKINHPNIVRILDFKKNEQDNLFLVMEYVPGGSVMDLLRKNPSGLEIETSFGIILDVACGLMEAERFKIIHRDIKPDNIMLGKNNVAKIADLGLAKEVGSPQTSGQSLTQEGLAIGSVEYMSPEQAMNAKKADHRSDIYSLGITFYQMLTGRLPFTGDSSYDVITKQINMALPDPRAFNPKISDATAAVVMKMCDKLPEFRYQTMQELINDIRVLKSGDSVSNLHATIISNSLADLDIPELRAGHNTKTVSMESYNRAVKRHSKAIKSPVQTTKRRRKPHSPYALIALVALIAVAVALMVLVGFLWLTQERPKVSAENPKTETNASTSNNDDVIASSRLIELANLEDEKVPKKESIETKKGKRILSSKPEKEKDFINRDINLRLNFIPAGEFLMGSPTSEKGRNSDEHIREINITSHFWIGECELTHEQFMKMKSKIRAEEFEIDAKKANQPMTNLNKRIVMELLIALTKQEAIKGLIPKGYCYRLPTEAEWEYAARANSKTAYFFGNDDYKLNNYAWRDGSIHKVKQKKANPWGLYDIYGNLSECVLDSYSAYDKSDTVNPFVMFKSPKSITRGGSAYQSKSSDFRSAKRSAIYQHGTSGDTIGYRIVLAPAGSLTEFMRKFRDRDRHKDRPRRPRRGF